MTIWIQRSDTSQTFLYLTPIFCVRSDSWWLLFFMTRHLPLSTVIGHVRDILNDPAAGVRALCPSFHGFGLQGYAYDFVWANSVTYESCLYTNVRLQEQPNYEHDYRDPPAPTFRLLYTWGRDFSMYFVITVYSRPIHFSLLKSFCNSINALLTYKLIAGGSGLDLNWFLPW